MTSVALLNDPYVLPMPQADWLVVSLRWISPGNIHPNSTYSEDLWSLGPLTDNPSTAQINLRWQRCPPAFQNEMRLRVWTLINGELRPTFLKGRTTMRSRIGVVALKQTFNTWMRLATWLQAQGINTLGDCTEDVWLAYMAHLRETTNVTRGTALLRLIALTRLWAIDGLTAQPSGIAEPPWEVQGVDDFLPVEETAGMTGENATEALTPEVMGPLLTWAVRMVEDLSDDILAGWDETRHMLDSARSNPSRDGGQADVVAYLQSLLDGNSRLPGQNINGTYRLAHAYVAARMGASQHQVTSASTRLRLPALPATRFGACPLTTPITGQIAGRPWRERLDFYETAALMRNLGTAAFIVISYLSGMRPQEVLGMRSGCCPDPEPGPGGAARRHLIRSHHYKTVTNDDGYHVSAGEERDAPWVAIPPVVNAIRMLERMVPPGRLLFESALHNFVGTGGQQHGALKLNTMRERIEVFVLWANAEAAARQIPWESIPPDPHGEIGLRRFRRTLAWHIARQPGGLVALAIQYGHLRTMLDLDTASGYGSRSRRGLHGLINVETALATAETAAHLHECFQAGEGVSGPAARRALTVAEHTPDFKGRLVKTNMASKFLSRDGSVLYDNPKAFLLCLYRTDKALCRRAETDAAPSLLDCKPGCGNAVRTDTHATRMRARADELDHQSDHVPGPMAKRLHLNADRLRALAETHDAQRFTLEGAV